MALNLRTNEECSFGLNLLPLDWAERNQNAVKSFA